MRRQRLNGPNNGRRLNLFLQAFKRVITARNGYRQIAKAVLSKNDLAAVVRNEAVCIERVRAWHRAIEHVLNAIRLDAFDSSGEPFAVGRATVGSESGRKSLGLDWIRETDHTRKLLDVVVRHDQLMVSLTPVGSDATMAVR